MDSLKTEKIRIAKQADVFITKTATKTLTSTDVVEKVMNFHFRDLRRALVTYTSVEISGFGRFTMSQNKILRRLKDINNYRNILLKRIEEKNYTNEIDIRKRLLSVEEEITYLETRKQIDETRLQDYFRRMNLEHERPDRHI